MKDAEFLRGERVPMTKEEVRLLVLERLDLPHASLLVDVGAGTGSVALEAALRHPALQVIAIEKNPDALRLINTNRARVGCEQQVRIVDAIAPCELSLGEQSPGDRSAAGDQPVRPDAIFIGGSGGNLAELIDWSLHHLQAGGRLVLSCILLDNVTRALELLRAAPVAELDCTQLQISQLTGLGSGYYFRPNNPVFVISCRKETSDDRAL